MGEGTSISLVDLPQELQLFILSFLHARSHNQPLLYCFHSAHSLSAWPSLHIVNYVRPPILSYLVATTNWIFLGSGVLRSPNMDLSWSLRWTLSLYLPFICKCYSSGISLALQYHPGRPLFLIDITFLQCLQAFSSPLIWTKSLGKCATIERSSWKRRTLCISSPAPVLPP